MVWQLTSSLIGPNRLSLLVHRIFTSNINQEASDCLELDMKEGLYHITKLTKVISLINLCCTLPDLERNK